MIPLLMLETVDLTYMGLGLLDMLLLEEELPVQVGEIDRIQIDLDDGTSFQSATTVTLPLPLPFFSLVLMVELLWKKE